jgi:hypothetical protein
MDRYFPIDIDLISKITRLPKNGVKLEQYLDEKMKENTTTEEVKSQFGTDRGSRGMIIKKINETTTRFMKNMVA